MAPRDGQIVIVNYRGTLNDGTEFDSSYGRAPLQFTVGAGDVIPGFDEAVRGLEVGESKTVSIPCDQAYGEHTDDAVQQFPRDAFPPEPTPEVGWMVELESEDGQRIPATVVEVGDEHVMLDFNHPLSGEDLTFEIELVSVGPEPEGE
ncbi:MAG TPA: peptidylprolyl isomerase [Coriobacteriia bacterium]|nr:peptidylprolyl isomerase [Coriobacteriia bacterium]